MQKETATIKLVATTTILKASEINTETLGNRILEFLWKNRKLVSQFMTFELCNSLHITLLLLALLWQMLERDLFH